MAKQAYRITWRQASIEKRVDNATKAGLNETMEAAVRQAKVNAPVLTGALRDDIAYKPAEQSGTRIVGRWGNWEIPYAIFQEDGTIYIPAVRYLRRAQDQEYPQTAARIKRHL